MRGDFLDRVVNIGKIGVAIAAPHGGPYSEKNQIRFTRYRGELGREAQAAGTHILLHERVESRLIDWNFAAVQLLDLAPVFLDASDVPAKIRETGGGNQADISGPDHADVHGIAPSNELS